MRLLIIDSDSCGLDLAMRAAAYGHEVRWYLRAHKGGAPRKDGNGVKGITKVASWKDSMPWAKAGVVFLTGNDCYIDEMDRWRDFGFRKTILGPTRKSADLEVKRADGMELLKRHGIDVPPYKTFNSLREAENAAARSDEAWVFKTLGDEDDKSLTYVSSSPADMVGRLRRWQEQGMRLKGPCMLQEKIDGVEFGCSAWLGPEGFLPAKWNICFEHKKLMPGNYGPNTGEMGTVMQYVRDEKLADEVLRPIERALTRLGHSGDVDLNCIIDAKGRPWPLEFTCRPGWPAFAIMSAMHQGDPVGWMKDLLRGNDSLAVDYRTSLGVVVAKPDFPYFAQQGHAVEGIPVYGVDPSAPLPNDVHPFQMMIGKGPVMAGERVTERPVWQTSGQYVMVCTGAGDSVRAAQDAVYGLVDTIKVADMIVRNDIGDGLKTSLPQLHRHGYATEMEFS